MNVVIYLLAAVTLVGWFGGNWFLYVSDLPTWFVYTAAGFSIFLGMLTLFALFRRKWRAAAVGVLTLLFIFLPKLKVAEPIAWVQQTGFSTNASPIEEYLSKCKLLTISENDGLQQIGQCASLSRGHRRIDIVYDTTGKALWPVAAMNPEWKAAANKLFSTRLLSALPTRVHITGNFYAFVYEDREG